VILDAGFWMLDRIRNSLIFLICRKRQYNKLIIFLGNVNGRVFIPAEDGISASLQQASSIQHPVSLRLPGPNRPGTGKQ
jgi:hypothetical protein